MATVLDPPVGRRTGADRANRTPARIGGQGRRDPADDGKLDSERLGVEAAEPVRSAVDSRYIFTANQAGPTSSICYPIRTAAPWPSDGSKIAPPHGAPNGRTTTALVDPDASGFVTEASPDPTLHAWVGSADQHPVA